ncbi:MAG: DUF4340 domain-containing protein, partial [Rhodospirillales bacterium]|nr:DUF4340 domain-containing protein [Rhodospirillales bacterium]
TLAILVACGVVALAGGWYFGVATTPHEQVAVDAGKLMFPDLAPRLQHATKVEVEHQGKTMEIDKRPDGTWGLADRAGYRVQEPKLRGMLTALTELRLVEPRTSDPAQFPRLGVEDPASPTSNSNLLRVLDSAGKPLVAVIVGHRRVRTQGNVPDQVYVRRPDQDQTWLAEGSLQVDAEPTLWFDRDVMNIDHARIATVVAQHGADTIELARQGDKITVVKPADHGKLESYRVEDVSRALELLAFQDVQPDTAPVGPESGRAVFTTTDGLALTATVYQGDKDIWVRFAVAGDGAAKAEADRLRSRLAGWTFQFGSWKEKALVPRLADLEAKPEAAEAGGGKDAGAPSPPSSGQPRAATAPAAGSEATPAAPAKP